jgi:D,D-heptose 1,7-bisphosphate phosphatase
MTRPFHRRAVFLDKDDTLMQDVPGAAAIEYMQWVPDAFRSLARMRRAGYELVLVTNQPCIADGLYSEQDFARYLDHLTLVLALKGIRLLDAVYCPHHPDAAMEAYRTSCLCRKPHPGMITRAADRLGIDLDRSWMIGDLLTDVEAGARAGCWTALLAVHDDQIPPPVGPLRPDVIAPNLGTATDAILSSLEAVS